MKKILEFFKRLWYGSAGEAWWKWTDEVCGKGASVQERIEATREFL